MNSTRKRIPRLCSEIIALILISLPVGTLSILKCVSTYFSRLISSPEFIREHLKFSTQDASMSSCKVVVRVNSSFTYSFYNPEEKRQLKQTSIQSLCHESPVNIVKLAYPYPYTEELKKRVNLVGSCNGLVVIVVNRKHLFLWNPTTRKHKRLPTIAGHEILHIYKTNFYCGFGFDASNDDYKVLAMFGVECPDSMSISGYVVYVYNLKRNSWIRISDLTSGQFDNFSGKLASGNLHWCTTDGDIVSFDVEREVFGTLELPNFDQGFSIKRFSLRVLAGSISVCCFYDGHVDVWAMKEYGMVVSWTKMLTFSEFGSVSPQPCYILPNGEVLIEAVDCYIYNPKDNSWRSKEIRSVSESVIYVESLVSPCCE